MGHFKPWATLQTDILTTFEANSIKSCLLNKNDVVVNMRATPSRFWFHAGGYADAGVDCNNVYDRDPQFCRCLKKTLVIEVCEGIEVIRIFEDKHKFDMWLWSLCTYG